MENAADALKMAGALLIFVLALSIILLFFSNVRATSDAIVEYRDRESFYTRSGYYTESITATTPKITYNGSSAGDKHGEPTRLVGMETAIQTIIRAYIENYKIVIYDRNGDPLWLYKIKYPDSSPSYRVNHLDLETTYDNNNKSTNVTIANDEQKVEFLKGILYGQFGTSSTDVEKANFEKDYSVDVTTDGWECFYDQYKDDKFYEFFGVYHQNDAENIPDIMKYEKRIITYVLK